ncbi:hypothetical protein M3Y99_00580500 [Aphelenchoides fujianensis]|nr:hypothetical protein M3Y99_00580500 [Aphelenchoides fujianensis]
MGDSTGSRRESSPLAALALLLLVLARITGGVAASDEQQHSQQLNGKCVPIAMDACTEIPYNMTIFPNLLQHASQEDANAEIQQYAMLLRARCSPYFKFFLCSLFAPVCTVLDKPIPPCRHLCLSAKSGCEEVMNRYGYRWPEILNCNKFPDPPEMCVGENTTKSAKPTDSPAAATKRELECPHMMKVLSKSRYVLQIANTTIEQCSLPCDADDTVPTFFTVAQRTQLRLLALVSGVVCAACALFTVITFLIDIERFEFPERAILYMSVCYLFVAVTYLVGGSMAKNVACSGLSSTQLPLVTQGIDNFFCSAVAFTHYYFALAGALWWLVLCFAWFLVTTLKWGEAPVGQVFGSYFTVLAWGLPAVGSVLILVTDVVNGDLFTGMCTVGNLQSKALLHYVAIPQAVLICGGFFLFACGFVSILRIRSYIKEQRPALSKFEAASGKISRLMIRISTFAVLCLVSMVVYTLCIFYQALNMDAWLTSWYATRCLHAQRGTFGFTQPREMCPIDEAEAVGAQPNFWFFCCKYVAQLSVGLACVVWTINGKTFNSYGDFYARVIHGRSRVPTRQP